MRRRAAPTRRRQGECVGLDPQRDVYELRERTGVQLQSSNLPHRMRVEEALNLFSSFYRQTVDWHPLLEELGLPDKQRALYSQLSGGQKQRLFVTLALINRPEILFLDELTTGLDPQARHATWDLVRKIQGDFQDRGFAIFRTSAGWFATVCRNFGRQGCITRGNEAVTQTTLKRNELRLGKQEVPT